MEKPTRFNPDNNNNNNNNNNAPKVEKKEIHFLRPKSPDVKGKSDTGKLTFPLNPSPPMVAVKKASLDELRPAFELIELILTANEKLPIAKSLLKACHGRFKHIEPIMLKAIVEFRPDVVIEYTSGDTSTPFVAEIGFPGIGKKAKCRGTDWFDLLIELNNFPFHFGKITLAGAQLGSSERPDASNEQAYEKMLDNILWFVRELVLEGCPMRKDLILDLFKHSLSLEVLRVVNCYCPSVKDLVKPGSFTLTTLELTICTTDAWNMTYEALKTVRTLKMYNVVLDNIPVNHPLLKAGASEKLCANTFFLDDEFKNLRGLEVLKIGMMQVLAFNDHLMKLTRLEKRFDVAPLIEKLPEGVLDLGRHYSMLGNKTQAPIKRLE